MPDAPRSLRVDAVVLRHSDWGEADRMLTLYTREQGKMRCIAKGVRRLRSRKAGHLEPFTHVALMLARGRDLWIVTQAVTLDAYLPLREDLLRTGYAAYVIELLDRFTYEEGENRALFNLLVDTLKRISEEQDTCVSVRYYEIRLLDLLGFRPELFYCTACRAPVRPVDQFFSYSMGGVLCPQCGPRYADARPISVNVLKYLRHFQRSTYAEVQRSGIPAAVREEMEAILNAYLTYLLERKLNTPAFLREIRREGNNHPAA
ncbi:MAG: DNA repair protein RecO [Chloroflexi bacterium]|nr:DNA repair protein RecO [Anaerolineaceae bacterium]NMB91157.1 DNA repair protein RecO [Chloroflexota bacterium]